jgi:hypothetical protein
MYLYVPMYNIASFQVYILAFCLPYHIAKLISMYIWKYSTGCELTNV